MPNKGIAIPILILLMVLIADVGETANLRRVTVPMAEAAVITPARDSVQRNILLKPDLAFAGRHAHVILAVLCVEVSQLDRDANGFAVQLELLPVATQWAAEGVSWDYPWTVPGGDIAKGSGETFFMAGSGQARFDVTRLVQAWLDGTLENCGMIIKTRSAFGGSYDVDLSLGGGNELSSIELRAIVRDSGS